MTSSPEAVTWGAVLLSTDTVLGVVSPRRSDAESMPSRVAASTGSPTLRNDEESRPSTRSAFRLVTLVVPVTLNGALSVLVSKLAAGPPPVFLSLRVGSLTPDFDLRVVDFEASFLAPRTR